MSNLMSRRQRMKTSSAANCAAIIASRREECLKLLADINEHVESHFEVDPDTAHYGHVGDATNIRDMLKRIVGQIKGEELA